jgi:hypothetical protein
MAKRTKPGMTGVPEAILPLTDFRDDPWATGDKNAASFRAGVMSSPVPFTFARKMRDEGKAAPKPSAPATEPAADTAEDQPAED